MNNGIVELSDAVRVVLCTTLGFADSRHHLILLGDAVPNDVWDDVPRSHRCRNHLFDNTLPVTARSNNRDAIGRYLGVEARCSSNTNTH